MTQAEQLWLAVKAVDVRRGIDGMSFKVQQALGRSPCDGSAPVHKLVGNVAL